MDPRNSERIKVIGLEDYQAQSLSEDFVKFIVC